MNSSKALSGEQAALRESAHVSVRAPRWLAWLLWTTAVAQVVLGLTLAVLSRLSFERYLAEYVIAETAATLAFATVGVLIATRRPEHRIGWFFCAAGVSMGLTTWTGQYARYALVTQPGSLPGADVVAWLAFWTWIPAAALTVVFLPLFFSTGRLPSNRWNPALWAGIAGTGTLAAALALSPGPLDASLPEVVNPFPLKRALVLLNSLTALGTVLMLAGLASAVAAQVARFRRGSEEEREQLKWFAYATALLVSAFLAPIALDPAGFDDPDSGSTLLSGTLLAVAFPLLPIATGVAVLQYRLYDIEGIINRTLVYGALTGCVVGVYVFVVGYLGVLFQAGDNLLVSLVATGMVAAMFAPLRDVLQRGVNRLMYGDRDEPYRAISLLGERLEAALAPDAVLPSIVATVREALKLPYVAVALPDEDSGGEGRFAVTALSGEPPPDPLRLPLSYQGETIGELLIGYRAVGEHFSAADRRLLDDLAHHAGVAVHGVRVMADLQRSRERLILAREEERRRIRRDLHDELAPMLAALGLTAATVGELIARDPARAAAVNAKLQAALRTTVADVRRLVYDLRPSALDELGLVAALRERAEQYSGGAQTSLRVTVEAPAALSALPAAVEVAAYRIIQEALANVVRHASACTCAVRLVLLDGNLHINVVDDGVGLPPLPRVGIGLRSMQERAAEIGGACTVEPATPTGTRVSACLPLSGMGRTRQEEGNGAATRADCR
jgi:signal transduction histidine kinase